MRALSVMMKPSSGNCSMRCNYCFYYDEMENREQELYGYMSEDTLRNIIRKTMLQTEQEITYAYQGGEPTLRGLDFFRKAVELQKKYNHNHIRVNNAIQTNGYGLTEEWCRFFKENNFLVGVSVDGTKEIHNTYRRTAGKGAPTYDVIRRNIEMMDRIGVEYNILTVVTELVGQHPEEIYDDYRKNGWMYQQYIECLDPLDAKKGSSPYSLRPQTYGVFLTKLFDLWYEDYRKGKQPYIRKFENYIGILAGFPTEACDQCGHCTLQIVVEADGSVYPCDFYMLDEFYMGNFNEERLPQLYQRGEGSGFVQRSLQVSEECRHCKYFGVCRNGCYRNRELGADGETYKNYFCEGYRYFFDHCIDRMAKIAATLRR